MRQEVPIFCSPHCEAVLGQYKLQVWNDDPIVSTVFIEDACQVFWFSAASDLENCYDSVIEDQLFNC